MSGAAAQGKIIPRDEGETSGNAPVEAGVEDPEETAEDMTCSSSSSVAKLKVSTPHPLMR